MAGREGETLGSLFWLVTWNNWCRGREGRGRSRRGKKGREGEGEGDMEGEREREGDRSGRGGWNGISSWPSRFVSVTVMLPAQLDWTVCVELCLCNFCHL